MITISDLSCAIGKRLTHCIEGNSREYLLLKFDDGTLCQIHARTLYEDVVLEQDADFDYDCYVEEELLDAGVIDKAWIAERVRRAVEAQEKSWQREEQDAREQLARLKKRFGE